MKITAYNSLLTNKKTILVMSGGIRGYNDFVEYYIMLDKNSWYVYRTNGRMFDLVKTFDGSKGLKSIINLYYRG
jgi:hypothetical protein